MEFDDLALFGYLDQLGAEFDVELWDIRSVAGRGMRDPGSARTVGFGLMKRWTVRRTNRDDLPTLASPGERKDVQGSHYTPTTINLRTWSHPLLAIVGVRTTVRRRAADEVDPQSGSPIGYFRNDHSPRWSFRSHLVPRLLTVCNSTSNPIHLKPASQCVNRSPSSGTNAAYVFRFSATELGSCATTRVALVRANYMVTSGVLRC